MSDQIFLNTQVLELQRLLEIAGDDPILAPQLRARLAKVEAEQARAVMVPGSFLPRESVQPSRAAIFLRGDNIDGAPGISATLAGDVLVLYERMFVEQALHDEREAARQAGRQRRRRGMPFPSLLLTGTPRGSFGLEFVAKPTDEGTLPEIHAQSLHHVADALVRVAASGPETLERVIERIPQRMLPPLQKFITILADHDAELRLAFADQRAQVLSIEQLKMTSELLSRGISQETVTIQGVFRGLTRESGWFDLKTQAGEIITGLVADNLTEEDLDRIDSLTNHNCTARLEKTTVIKVTGPATPSYVLLDAEPLDDVSSSRISAADQSAE